MTVKRSMRWISLSFENWDRLVVSNEKVKGDRVSIRLKICEVWTPFIIVWDEWRVN